MHGGDIYRNKVNIDLSVNLNPFGIPAEVREAIINSVDRIATYPDLKCEALQYAFAGKINVSPSSIVCGNGVSELIMAIAHAFLPKTALLVAPCYKGYEYALNAADCEISYAAPVDFLYEIRAKKPDMVFFGNPSNPTGELRSLDYVKELVDACKENGTYLIVDECFIMLTTQGQDASCVPFLNDYDRLYILRGLTKSFALAGLRLGAILCPEGKDLPIRKHLPEWNVSVVAQEAGLAALNCTDFLKFSAREIAKDRETLTKILEKRGYEVYPSDANYILFSSEDEGYYERCLKKGVLIRDCSDYPGLGKGYYRIVVNKESIRLFEEGVI